MQKDKDKIPYLFISQKVKSIHSKLFVKVLKTLIFRFKFMGVLILVKLPCNRYWPKNFNGFFSKRYRGFFINQWIIVRIWLKMLYPHKHAKKLLTPDC